MARGSRKQEEKSFAEEADSLWLITFAGGIWAVHFALSYGATAIVCAKWASSPDAVTALRLAIAAATTLALAGIVMVGWRSWRQWDSLDDHDHEHQLAKEEHRHAFLGHASFLLSIISFIGVVYVALPVLLLKDCL